MTAFVRRGKRWSGRHCGGVDQRLHPDISGRTVVIVVRNSLLDRFEHDGVNDRMGQSLLGPALNPHSRQLGSGERGICVAFGVYRDNMAWIIEALTVAADFDVR